MKTVINIKADKEVRDQAVETAKSMGVPLSTIVNAFLKKFITERSVTFTAPIVPSKMLAKIIKQATGDIKKGVNLSPVFTDTKDMDAYLNSL